MPTPYEQDFYTWTQEQAALLRAGRVSELDLANLAEEVESMGRSEKRELESRMAVIICHLLKLLIQTNRTAANEKSWINSLDVQRDDLADHLQDNPGLKTPAIMKAALAKAWKRGRDEAIRETDLDRDDFPTENPFGLDQIMDPTFLPPGPHSV